MIITRGEGVGGRELHDGK